MERSSASFMEAAAARVGRNSPSRPRRRQARGGDPVGGGTVASQILKHIDGGDIALGGVLPRRVRRRRAAGVARDGLGDRQGVPPAVARRASGQKPQRGGETGVRQTGARFEWLRDPTQGRALRRFADRAFRKFSRGPGPPPAARRRRERADAVDFSSDILRQQRGTRASRRSAEGDGVPATRAVAGRGERLERRTTRRTPAPRAGETTGSKPTATTGLKRGAVAVRSVAPIRLGLRRRRAGAASAREPRRARARARQRPGDHPLASGELFGRVPRRDCRRRRVCNAFRVSRRVY